MKAMLDTGEAIALIKSLNKPADPSTIADAVENWLDDHPEAVAVQDNSISYAKLNASLKSSIDDISTKADKTNTVLTGSLSMGRTDNTTVGSNSTALGASNTASGNYSHAEGNGTTASNTCSHAEGGGTTASNTCAHAEGGSTTASGSGAHAEGGLTTASGSYAHAEGSSTTASGEYAHAEGGGTTASGAYAHAEGGSTTASGACAHAEGGSTTASGDYQHVSGKNNVIDNLKAEIIGNGSTSESRSNARALDWSGNEYLKGDLYVGCNADSTGGTKVAKITDLPDVSGKLLSNDIKTALLACFQNVTWDGNNGQTYYNALYEALYGVSPTP